MTPKEKIIDAAIKAFTVRGIKSVTMDSIAQTAGVSKRTVYELFEDKDSLVIEALGQMIINHNKAMINIIGHTENIIEALFLIIEKEARRQAEISPLLVQDMEKYFPLVNAAFFKDPQKICMYSATYTFLQSGIDQGIIRKELKLEFVDTFLHEIIRMVHLSDRIRLLNPAKEDYLNNMFLPYFRGICTRKGMMLMEIYFDNLTE